MSGRTNAHVVDAGGVLGSVGDADFLIVLRIVDTAQDILLRRPAA
jgi:hypothetical protein